MNSYYKFFSSEEYSIVSNKPLGIIYVRINISISIINRTEYAEGKVHLHLQHFFGFFSLVSINSFDSSIKTFVNLSFSKLAKGFDSLSSSFIYLLLHLNKY